jgi:preprotein translocase subunit YajC
MTMFASLGNQFFSECALFLQGEAAPVAPQGGAYQPLLIMVLLFVGMYFLIIAPQRKKQKEHAKMVAAVKSGDEVLTSGGIYGTVTNVKPDRIVVKIADNTKIEVNRNFIQTVLTQSSNSQES